ncbi:hypothetical protein OFP26_40245, partial [Escherichia coli]|nr:hypothetical protein [Escherichia coli]
DHRASSALRNVSVALTSYRVYAIKRGSHIMPSMPKAIEHTIQNHVAVITMNNPPANTWTADSLHALKALVCTLNQNKDVY